MIVGLLLGISVAFLLVSGYIMVVGLVQGFASIAYTGAVVGGDGYVSYAIIVFVFSLIATVFLLILLNDKRRMKYFG